MGKKNGGESFRKSWYEYKTMNQSKASKTKKTKLYLPSVTHFLPLFSVLLLIVLWFCSLIVQAVLQALPLVLYYLLGIHHILLWSLAI